MREITLGQYYPVKSVLHRMDPRMKLIIMIMYIVMIFFIKTFVGFGIVLVFLALTIALSHVPLLKVLKSLKVIIILVIFTVIMSVLFYNGKAEDLLWSAGTEAGVSGAWTHYAYFHHHAGGTYRRTGKSFKTLKLY